LYQFHKGKRPDQIIIIKGLDFVVCVKSCTGGPCAKIKHTIHAIKIFGAPTGNDIGLIGRIPGRGIGTGIRRSGINNVPVKSCEGPGKGRTKGCFI
jgi:hypothetical protein